jgi:murein DD-endopeptidase MepM/ murein hydrolase activator NlpD
MAGKKNRKWVHGSCWLLVALVLLFGIACGRRKVAIHRMPSPPEKVVEQGGVYHVVERHQTLYRICKTYQVDLPKVASLNGITDRHKIETGQRIFIPGAKKVLHVEIYLEDVVEESEGKEREKPGESRMGFSWPLEGRLTDSFEENEAKRHQGIDISCPRGTPIKAAGSGKVVYSGNTVRGYGNMIILRHSEEWVTVYAHNDVNLVEEGMWVERGQRIARVGQTGRASGPHLHFEVRKNNQPVNPRRYLR